MVSSRTTELESLRNKIRQIQDGTSSFNEINDSCMDSSLSEGLSSAPSCKEAFSRILRLSSVRDRSSKELRLRLADEDFDIEEIEVALAKAIEYRIVDDMRFADGRIRKMLHDKKGIVGIERELAKHDIELSQVTGWPHDYQLNLNENEVDRAISFLERRPSRSKNLMRGSYQKLIGNGYSSEVAMRAARIWSSSH